MLRLAPGAGWRRQSWLLDESSETWGNRTFKKQVSETQKSCSREITSQAPEPGWSTSPGTWTTLPCCLPGSRLGLVRAAGDPRPILWVPSTLSFSRFHALASWPRCPCVPWRRAWAPVLPARQLPGFLSSEPAALVCWLACGAGA